MIPWFKDTSMINSMKNIVKEVTLYVGDVLHFHYDSTQIIQVHDLWDMDNLEAFDTCDFTADGVTMLADFEEIQTTGYDVLFNEVGTYYFTCSISCLGEAGGEDREDMSFCHCRLGQKLIVHVEEVESDNIVCHDHPPLAKDEEGMTTATTTSTTVVEHSKPLDCGDAMENAYAINNAVYGAMSSDECSEICAPAVAISFMGGMEAGNCVDVGYPFSPQTTMIQIPGAPTDVQARITHNAVLLLLPEEDDDGTLAPMDCGNQGMVNGWVVNNVLYGAMNEKECSELCAPAVAISFMEGVELGSCVDQGYIYNPKLMNVRPPGSPMNVDVRITTNANTGSTSSSGSTCHCHYYEPIECDDDDEDGVEPTGSSSSITRTTALSYSVLINDMKQHCQSLVENGVDSSTTYCPYECFRIMNILHLHYIECPTRQVDPMYATVNSTGLCHDLVYKKMEQLPPLDNSAISCPIVDLSEPPVAVEPPFDNDIAVDSDEEVDGEKKKCCDAVATTTITFAENAVVAIVAMLVSFAL